MSIDNRYEELRKSDRDHLWHPFTQMRQWAEEEPLIITEGRGAFIRDMRGRWYLDGVSSLWVNIHGHRHRRIDEALKAQIDRIAHTTTLGLGNEPSILLASRIARMIGLSLGAFNDEDNPNPPSRVFYSDDGSTAVEVALKMAFQYHLHKGREGRNTFISLNNAYHGDTLGAVSVGGIGIFHEAFGPLLMKTHKAPSPFCYRCELGHMDSTTCGMQCLGRMEELILEHAHEVAAVIVEPLVQAAGGMLVSAPGYLKGVRELCSRYGVPLIVDEIATGFGRTGRMLASEHEVVVPDIVCLSKGITGGYLPLAVTVATDEIYGAFLGEFSELKTFFHGHSYTGNPLGCAAALACLDVFEEERTLDTLAPKIAAMELGLAALMDHPNVGHVRNAGLMAGVELVRDKSAREPFAWEQRMGWRVTHALRKRGVIIRPLGNVLVLMPPLCTSAEDIGAMMRCVAESIEEVLPKKK